jgi:hypothetical protein
MNHTESLHRFLDVILEVRRSDNLTELQDSRLEAAEECIYGCMKRGTVTTEELCFIFERVAEFIKPPDPE